MAEYPPLVPQAVPVGGMLLLPSAVQAHKRNAILTTARLGMQSYWMWRLERNEGSYWVLARTTASRSRASASFISCKAIVEGRRECCERIACGLPKGKIAPCDASNEAYLQPRGKHKIS